MPVLALPATMPIAHPDSTILPVAVVRQPGTDPDAGAPRKRRQRIERGPIHIDDARLVLRDVDDIRLRGYDSNYIWGHENLLLRRVDECAGGASLRPEPLNRVHDISGLGEERLADLPRPLEIVVEPFEDVGVKRERFHAVVPGAQLNL